MKSYQVGRNALIAYNHTYKRADNQEILILYSYAYFNKHI